MANASRLYLLILQWAHLPHDIPDDDERLKLEELMASPGDLKS